VRKKKARKDPEEESDHFFSPLFFPLLKEGEPTGRGREEEREEEKKKKEEKRSFFFFEK